MFLIRKLRATGWERPRRGYNKNHIVCAKSIKQVAYSIHITVYNCMYMYLFIALAGMSVDSRIRSYVSVHLYSQLNSLQVKKISVRWDRQYLVSFAQSTTFFLTSFIHWRLMMMMTINVSSQYTDAVSNIKRGDEYIVYKVVNSLYNVLLLSALLLAFGKKKICLFIKWNKMFIKIIHAYA